MSKMKKRNADSMKNTRWKSVVKARSRHAARHAEFFDDRAISPDRLNMLLAAANVELSSAKTSATRSEATSDQE